MMPASQPLLGSAESGFVGGGTGGPGRGEGEGEDEILEGLRRGDDAVFALLVDKYHASMTRVACLYVESTAAAEEVAQEAWLGVLQGLGRFQGRCTLKAWIFSIVANCAKSRGARDKRTVPLSAVAQEDGGASVDPERFLEDGHPRWPGHWRQPPAAWDEDDLVSRETLRAIREAMEGPVPDAARRDDDEGRGGARLRGDVPGARALGG